MHNKCPHCNEEIDFVVIDSISAKDAKGVERLSVLTLGCPSCCAVLEILPDPEKSTRDLADYILARLEQGT